MEVNRSDEMLKYVEGYYRDSYYYTAQNSAKGQEFDIIHAIVEDMPNQFNPQTATWGLRLWEEMLGIDTGEDSIEERRAKVMLKLLTLQRITPISLERLIKNVTKANVDILRNVAPYTFQVRVREDSLDCDNGLIRRIVEDYKEAHMAFYQAFFLGQIVIRERFYLRTEHRMSVYWFGDNGILNGRFVLDGRRNLDTMFPPYNMRTWHKTSVSFVNEVLFGKTSNAFTFILKEHLPVASVHDFTFYWWGEGERLLNGTHFLNGDIALNRIFPPYRLEVFNCFRGLIVEKFYMKPMRYSFFIRLVEKAKTKNFFRTDFCWWGSKYNLLNGKSNLEGSVFLDQEFPPFKMVVSHKVTTAIFENLKAISENTMRVKIREQMGIRNVVRAEVCWWEGALNGSITLNGERRLDNGYPEYNGKIFNRTAVSHNEKVSSPSVTITHNLWRLDGMVALDGSQTLDAYQIKEVLN